MQLLDGPLMKREFSPAKYTTKGGDVILHGQAPLRTAAT
jgi:hypothetical protein